MAHGDVRAHAAASGPVPGLQCLAALEKSDRSGRAVTGRGDRQGVQRILLYCLIDAIKLDAGLQQLAQGLVVQQRSGIADSQPPQHQGQQPA